MTRDASRFCLYCLSTSNLQSFRRGVRVQCHILCLERSRGLTILQEDTAQGCGKDALANITARTSQHDGMKSLHNVQRYDFSMKSKKGKVKNMYLCSSKANDHVENIYPIYS